MSVEYKLATNIEGTPKEAASAGKTDAAVLRETVTKASERDSLDQQCPTFDDILKIHMR